MQRLVFTIKQQKKKQVNNMHDTKLKTEKKEAGQSKHKTEKRQIKQMTTQNKTEISSTSKITQQKIQTKQNKNKK